MSLQRGIRAVDMYRYTLHLFMSRILRSCVAQWKRAGLITRRSSDRNGAQLVKQLGFCVFFFFFKLFSLYSLSPLATSVIYPCPFPSSFLLSPLTCTFFVLSSKWFWLRGYLVLYRSCGLAVAVEESGVRSKEVRINGPWTWHRSLVSISLPYLQLRATGGYPLPSLPYLMVGDVLPGR